MVHWLYPYRPCRLPSPDAPEGASVPPYPLAYSQERDLLPHGRYWEVYRWIPSAASQALPIEGLASIHRPGWVAWPTRAKYWLKASIHPSPSSSWILPHSFSPMAQTSIMGILNRTPDSFSDGGKYLDLDQALYRAEVLIREGAHLLDIGGESTRPGADEVPLQVELDRVIPLVQALRQRFEIPISVDTRHHQVAQAALNEGAHMINDVSALQDDPEMIKVVAHKPAGWILMHKRGQPKDMLQNTSYEDLWGEILDTLQEALARFWKNGGDLRWVGVDPGIGFGKNTAQNLFLIRTLNRLHALGRPVLLGPSRKRFIGQSLGIPVQDRDRATVGAAITGVLAGAQMLRVHNVHLISDAVRMVDAILSA